jgi:hypothetical protein
LGINGSRRNRSVDGTLGRTKRCSGLAIKSVLMVSPRSRAADRRR